MTRFAPYVFPAPDLAFVNTLLAAPKKIVIVTHANPDGDAIGSSMGLYHVLRKNGHAVTVVTPNPMMNFLTWMDPENAVLALSKHLDAATHAVAQAEVIFNLDFNTLRQIRELGDLVAKSPAKKIMIDHHRDLEEFCDIVFSFPKAASTAELIYAFCVEMGWEKHFDAASASSIYCGIMTDTGNFRFDSVTAELHEIVAALLRRGANPAEIYGRVYENISLNALRLQGYVLLEKLQLLAGGKIALMALSDTEQKKFAASKSETDELVNLGLKIAGVKMAVFFYDLDGRVKVSLRGKGGLAMNEFSAKYYKGGGHFNAAGGVSEKSLAETVSEFIALSEAIDIK